MYAITYPLRVVYILFRGMISLYFGEFLNLNRTSKSMKKAIRDGELEDFYIGGGTP